jgi:hypothetical protein
MHTQVLRREHLQPPALQAQCPRKGWLQLAPVLVLEQALPLALRKGWLQMAPVLVLEQALPLALRKGCLQMAPVLVLEQALPLALRKGWLQIAQVHHLKMSSLVLHRTHLTIVRCHSSCIGEY